MNVIKEIIEKKQQFNGSPQKLILGVDKYLELKKELIKNDYCGYRAKSADDEECLGLKIEIVLNRQDNLEIS